MDENKNLVLEKQRRRYQLILEIWKRVNGVALYKSVNFRIVAKSLEFSEEETDDAFNYFYSEGFFEGATLDLTVSLSHRAIVEIENSITNPRQSTEHFPSTIIQNFNAPVGSVQTGNNNTANVNQNFGQNLSEILQQLAILRNEFQKLPESEKEEAIEVVDALEVEVISEKPSKGKIKSFLLATKDFAVKTGTEITSKILTDLIKSQLGISGE